MSENEPPQDAAPSEPALDPPAPPPVPPQRVAGSSRPHHLVLLVIRLLYIVLLVTVSLLPFVATITSQQNFTIGDYAGALLATFAFGAVVILVDFYTPNKRLASVFAIYLGLVAGLVAALAVGAILDLIAESWELTTGNWSAYLLLVKLAVGISLCYLAVSIVLTTKDDIRLVIPYVEFAKQVRGVRPLVLDTSALIDGRVEAYARTGFLDAPLLAPRFVIHELQTLSDSSDKLKRERGRRGLDLVTNLQANALVDVSIDETEVPGRSVDHKLIQMASDQNLRILTADYNLNKVAQIQGVTVLNLNDLANMLRPQVLPGQALTVTIVKPGEAPHQGVGYLADGTMVVVEAASEHIGDSVEVTVTNALQTSAGRMIFGRLEGVGGDEGAEGAEDGRAQRISDAATGQPRATGRPHQRRKPPSSRNPRR